MTTVKNLAVVAAYRRVTRDEWPQKHLLATGTRPRLRGNAALSGAATF